MPYSSGRKNLLQGLALLAALFFLLDFDLKAQAQDAPADAGSFVANTIGPETLLPLEQRGIIRLRWPAYQRRSRFEFKPYEKPIYRIFIAPEGVPASKGRVHVTYDTSYPFTNLEAAKKYNIMVDVEQSGRVVFKEALLQAKPLTSLVKWYVAPRAAGGRFNNPGTYSQPKDVQFANANAGPGDVVVLKSGVYFSPGANPDKMRHDSKLDPDNSGAPGAHILFLAESNDISQPNYVSFQTAWGNISVNKNSYLLFDGVNCDSDQGQNSRALTSVLGEYGRPFGIIIRNTYYRAFTMDKHIMVNAAREVMVENCFFPGCGSHNVYLCNNTYNRPEYANSRCIFRNNISMNATRNNVHANGYFDNFIIENNVMVGARVANISLGTVHRNSHVRNNITYSGAKQAMTLNFYNGVEMENKTPCSNIHVCHNTLVVPATAAYRFAAIIISDSRRDPFRQTIDGLFIKNNVLVLQREDSQNVVINMWESRHLNRMEVKGNLFHSRGNQWGYTGEVGLPEVSSSEGGIRPFSFFEEHWKKKTTFMCTDQFRDGGGNSKYETIVVKPAAWGGNQRTEDLNAIFVDHGNRDFRLADESPARGLGVLDSHTKRVIRDIKGNIRQHTSGMIDAGAFVAGSEAMEASIGLSEYQLVPSDAEPVKNLVPGKRALVAAARLKVRSPHSTSLANIGLGLVVAKKIQYKVVNINQDLIAEIEVNGKTKKAVFFKGDKEGYEKFWTTGWAHDIGATANGGETLDLKAYITVKPQTNIQSIGSSFTHDTIWGFDTRGRKIALTGQYEVNFGQQVD